MSSDSPSTPDYDSNIQENLLSDEFSSGLDLKSVPGKSKHKTGWTDEPVRSGSSGKYDCHKLNLVLYIEMLAFNTILIFICLFLLLFRNRNKPTQSEM